MGQFAGHGISNGEEIGPRLAALETMVTRLCSRLPPGNLSFSDEQQRPDAGGTPIAFSDGRARLVRDLLAGRQKRLRYFPGDLFSDPAWDMLLDLYASHYEHRQVAVSSLCIASGVPATTALRWINSMTSNGWFARDADPKDRRRIFIRISDTARIQMDRYFDDLKQVIAL